MATLTDRSLRKAAPQREPPPVKPPPSPPPPGGPRPRGSRLRGGVYLLAPLTAALAALFAIVAVVLAIVLGGGSRQVPPSTGAARLVPSDALLYLDVSTDSSRPAVRQALRTVRRFSGAPLLFAAVTGRLDAVLGGSRSDSIGFSSDVRPWLGREAAFAVLDTAGPAAGTLIVLDVRRPARARAFLAAQGALPDGAYRKVALLHEPSGTTLAFLGHYLILGQASSVTAAIDVARGRAPSLAHSTTYGRATADEPPDRVLGLYAPVAGVRRALAPSQGLLGALGVLLDQPALSAAAVAVSPAPAGLSVVVHSVLDPKLARSTVGQTSQVTPSLASVLPAGSAMLLDTGNLRRAAPKLLAAAAKVGVLGRLAPMLDQLGSTLANAGVNLDQLFTAFGKETAFAVVPGRAGAGPAPVIVGRTSRPRAARSALGDLEAALTQAFGSPGSGSGFVPQATEGSVAGVAVSELTLAPGFQLDWAVSHGLVVVSTNPAAIASVIDHRVALSGQPAYRSVLGALPSHLTSLVFFDLGPLLRLGSGLGLIGSGSLQALRPELEQIRAIGLASTRGQSDTTTELQLQIR